MTLFAAHQQSVSRLLDNHFTTPERVGAVRGALYKDLSRRCIGSLNLDAALDTRDFQPRPGLEIESLASLVARHARRIVTRHTHGSAQTSTNASVRPPKTERGRCDNQDDNN